MSKCPGQASRNLSVTNHPCPKCGYKVEFFSDELLRVCPRCRARVSQEQLPSCVEWCQAARECIGPQRYDEMMRQKKKLEEQENSANRS